MTSPPRCPACIERPELRRLDPRLHRAPLHRCDGCLGLLADKDTVALAGKQYHATHYVMVEGHGRHRCRACAKLFDGARGACPTCGEEQALECTRCEKRMALVHIAGVSLDVCWTCRTVWFDRGELGLLVRRHAAELEERLSSPGTQVAAGGALSALADGALTPDGTVLGAYVADVAVEGLANVAQASPEIVVAAGEGAIAVGEVAVEASSLAADVLLSIVSDIFS